MSPGDHETGGPTADQVTIILCAIAYGAMAFVLVAY